MQTCQSKRGVASLDFTGPNSIHSNQLDFHAPSAWSMCTSPVGLRAGPRAVNLAQTASIKAGLKLRRLGGYLGILTGPRVAASARALRALRVNCSIIVGSGLYIFFLAWLCMVSVSFGYV